MFRRHSNRSRGTGPRALLTAVSVGLLTLTSAVGMARAQVATVEYELGPDSDFATGCLEPSPCDCAIVLIGDVFGTLTLTQLLPPLGPVFEYAIDDIEWTVVTPTGSIAVTGEGYYELDVSPAGPRQRVTLQLVVDGVPGTFESVEFVPGAGDFPNSFSVGVYQPISGTCSYDGFLLNVRIPPVLPDFQRADCNDDGNFDIGDPVQALGLLFVSGSTACPKACDANDDGGFDVSDAVFALSALFAGGPSPSAPWPDCGQDPTADGLVCDSFMSCP